MPPSGKQQNQNSQNWCYLLGIKSFPGSSSGKEPACQCRRLKRGLIPGLGRYPGGGHGNPLQYSCLENPHGQRSLADYCSLGPKESDMTEATDYTHLGSKNWRQKWRTLLSNAISPLLLMVKNAVWKIRKVYNS